jgi:hypothetical protein
LEKEKEKEKNFSASKATRNVLKNVSEPSADQEQKDFPFRHLTLNQNKCNRPRLGSNSTILDILALTYSYPLRKPIERCDWIK